MRVFILIPLLILAFPSCRHKEKINSKESALRTVSSIESRDSESFESFNERFHSDSLFQMSRTVFPLQGKYRDGWDSTQRTPSTWVFMTEKVKKVFADSDYMHAYTEETGRVSEKYWIENSGFLSERKFELRKGKWYLVYFTDINL
jgi:hypothetical protein